MKHILSVSTVCSTLLFLGSAGLTHATTLFFSSDLTGGDVTTATPLGPNDAIQVYTAYLSTLVVSDAPTGNGSYVPLYLTESLNTAINELTISGSIAGAPGLAGVSTLVTIDLGSPLTANTSGGSFSLNFPTSVLSITLSPTLAADLGLTGTTFNLAELSDGADIGGDPGSFTSVGPALELSSTPASSVPEPGTWIMTILGVGFISIASRGRFTKILGY